MDIYAIIFFALAVFVCLRLYSVLGLRTMRGRPFRVSASVYRLFMIAAVLGAVNFVVHEAKWYSALALWWRETRINIDWHDPELYFSLALLAGSAALVAIIHEIRTWEPGRWKKAKPLDRHRGEPLDPLGPQHQHDRSRPTEEKHAMEEIDEGSRRAGWWKKAKPLDGLLRDHPSQRKADPGRRLTPGEIQRREQDSRTRL